MTHNTGQIIGKHVCEYTGKVVVQRKRTMYDAARAMERDAVEKRAAQMAKTKGGQPCAES